MADSATRNILGSLTTTFTAPATCNQVMLCSLDAGRGWQGQRCEATEILDATECWPTTTTDASAPGHYFGGWGFYSPGLYCPAGYTSACSAVNGVSTGWPMQFPMEEGETAVGCCPT